MQIQISPQRTEILAFIIFINFKINKYLFLQIIRSKSSKFIPVQCPPFLSYQLSP